MVGIRQALTLSLAARRLMASAFSTAAHGLGRQTALARAGDPALPAEAGWHSAVVSELSIAEELLDRLERTGQVGQELRILDDTTFEVRWR